MTSLRSARTSVGSGKLGGDGVPLASTTADGLVVTDGRELRLDVPQGGFHGAVGSTSGWGHSGEVRASR